MNLTTPIIVDAKLVHQTSKAWCLTRNHQCVAWVPKSVCDRVQKEKFRMPQWAYDQRPALHVPRPKPKRKEEPDIQYTQGMVQETLNQLALI